MTTTLMKPLEEWTDEEKVALLTRPADLPETVRESIIILRGLVSHALREWCSVQEDTTLRFSVADMASALNALEESRVLSNVLLSFAFARMRQLEEYLSSGRCAYCSWEYTDRTEWPKTDTTEEETAALMAASVARVSVAIREHVTVCESHPMRKLELRLAVAQSILGRVVHTGECSNWDDQSAGMCDWGAVRP